MPDEFEFDADGFGADLKETLNTGREQFNGKYKAQLEALAALSPEQVQAISPVITDLKKYDELIAVVKAASKNNLEQAALRAQIFKLGDVAVTIAKKIPSLAAIF